MQAPVGSTNEPRRRNGNQSETMSMRDVAHNLIAGNFAGVNSYPKLQIRNSVKAFP